MSALQRICHWHPDRRAIGVCVMTGKAICAECSTRYEGVNYSKQGLAQLQAQRAAAASRRSTAEWLLMTVGVLGTPVALGLMYLFYRQMFAVLIDLQQVGA